MYLCPCVSQQGPRWEKVGFLILNTEPAGLRNLILGWAGDPAECG